mgnify:CR=1 FL=1
MKCRESKENWWLPSQSGYTSRMKYPEAALHVDNPENPETKLPPRWQNPKNTPNRGAIFQRHVAVGVHTGLKNVTLRNDDVVRQGTWQTSRPLGVSTCPFLTSGWYYTFSIVIQFNLTCCRRKNKSQVSWYCPQPKSCRQLTQHLNHTNFSNVSPGKSK